MALKAQERRVQISSLISNDSCDLFIREIIDTEYGYFVWPSSIALARYLWTHAEQFKHGRFLEIGAGVGIVGILCSKIPGEKFVTISDLPDATIQQNLTHNISINNLPSNVRVIGLDWSHWEENEIRELAPDYILASDCFYESSDFEDIISLIRFCCDVKSHCTFICAYHVRNENTSLVTLLSMWNLEARTLQKMETPREVDIILIQANRTETQV